HPRAVASPAVLGSQHGPQVIRTAPCRRAVRSGHPEDFLLALRIDAEHLRGPTIRPDDVVARHEFSDVTPAEMSEHSARDRLCAAPHESARRHLDLYALDHAPRPFGAALFVHAA